MIILNDLMINYRIFSFQIYKNEWFFLFLWGKTKRWQWEGPKRKRKWRMVLFLFKDKSGNQKKKCHQTLNIFIVCFNDQSINKQWQSNDDELELNEYNVHSLSLSLSIFLWFFNQNKSKMKFFLLSAVLIEWTKVERRRIEEEDKSENSRNYKINIVVVIKQ